MQIPPTSQSLKSTHVLYWLVLLASLLPWAWLRIQQATHSDMLWLSEAALRILNGQSMSQAAYDPNPPLSIILYMPVALLQKYLGLPLHIGITLQSFGILAFATLMLNRLLKTGFDLSVQARQMAMTGYLLLNTVGAALVFGERDHLIGMILPPFILAQLALTRGAIKNDWIIWLFCILSAFLILLKPPHGLLPALFIAHRLWRWRSLKSLYAPDFISLTLLSTLYAVGIWFFFKDYVDIILPDMLRYYIPSVSSQGLWKDLLSLLAVALGLGLAGRYSRIEPSAKFIIQLFAFCATVSIIPIAAQIKGYYYHFLPALGFLAAAGALYFYEWVLRETRHKTGTVITTLAVGLLFAYSAAPLDFDYPRHSNYMSRPLPSEIQKEAAGKSIYIFNNDMSLSHEIAYYGDYTAASRFPSLWFLPGILNAKQMDMPGWQEDLDRYANMFASDLDTYKPDLVLLIEPFYFDPPIDLPEVLTRNPQFKQAWAHYTYVHSTTIDERDYLGTSALHGIPKVFRVYKRH